VRVSTAGIAVVGVVRDMQISGDKACGHPKRAHEGCPMLPPKTTEASAPEATEAATAASRRIARTRTHGYAVTREADHKRKPNKSRR
jgi:hypothetical protein